MAIFGFGKKKEEKVPCSCGGMCTPSEIAEKAKADAKKEAELDVKSSVKILGGGCAKCNALEASTLEALKELGMDTTIEHITDFSVIATYGVMTTPALVVDEKVLSMGKVLKKAEVIALLQKARG